MPFTFAHPAVILPLARYSYCHVPALVLGSLSPDFVYFLGGRAAFGIGHTWWGAWCVNLPLCFVFYAIYVKLWRDVLRDYLPDWLNFASPTIVRQPAKWTLIFTLSALIGMASHVLLDAFTHQTGYFVQQFAFLRETIWQLPVFKWLQYGGGVLGLLICALYWRHRAQCMPFHSHKTAYEKIVFWAMCAAITFIILLIWWLWQPLTLGHVATWVIRGVDSLVLAFSALAIGKRVQAA